MNTSDGTAGRGTGSLPEVTALAEGLLQEA